MNKKYVKSIYTHVVHREDIAIVCNTGNGRFIRIPNDCWKVIEEYIDSYSPEQICNAADADDQAYYKLIFEKLINNRILVLPEEERVNDVDLIITNRCNLKCIHCCADADGIIGNDTLDTHDWCNIIDILEMNKVKHIAITGGEPMIRKDFFDIVKYMKENFSGTLTLATNGTLINVENVHRLVESFNMISISIDGYDEKTCAKIRGAGVFAKVIKSVKLLIDAGFQQKNLSLSMVDTSITHNDIELFYSLCGDLGINPILRKFSAVGRGESEKWLETENSDKHYGMIAIEDAATLSEINLSYISCQNCNAGRTRIAIDERGDIYPCLVLNDKEYCMGNMLVQHSINRSEFGSKTNDDEKNIKFDNYEELLICNRKECSICDVGPFCHNCLGEFRELEKSKGLYEICRSNKEILERIIWK